MDAPFANAAFADQNGLNFPMLSDYQRTVVGVHDVAHDDLAGLQGYTATRRSVYVIDGDGLIRHAWGAPHPGVEPDYEAKQRSVASLGRRTLSKHRPARANSRSPRCPGLSPGAPSGSTPPVTWRSGTRPRR